MMDRTKTNDVAELIESENIPLYRTDLTDSLNNAAFSAGHKKEAPVVAEASKVQGQSLNALLSVFISSLTRIFFPSISEAPRILASGKR